MAGFGIQLPGYGLDPYGDPLFATFTLGTGTVTQVQVGGASRSSIQVSGQAEPINASGGVSSTGTGGSSVPAVNIGGGVIG